MDIFMFGFGQDGAGQERFSASKSRCIRSVVESVSSSHGGEGRYLVVRRLVGFGSEFVVAERNGWSIR